MRVLPTALPGVLIVEPDVFGDDRGFFMETYSARRYADAGIDAVFVQDNLSRSKAGVLRGLHLQNPDAQGKLVSVPQGAAFDVAVDVRRGSPGFGRWVGVALSGENRRQLWIPEGFAHGYCVTADDTLFAYKTTAPYNPAAELTVQWNDPAIGIVWPIAAPALSDKDRTAPPLAAIDAARLPVYESARR